jgi:hypothetical protein
LTATLIRHFYKNAECVTGKTPQRLLAAESVSLVLRILAKQALFTAQATTAMPAFTTRADASWGRTAVAVPVAGRMQVAVPVAGRAMWDNW